MLKQVVSSYVGRLPLRQFVRAFATPVESPQKQPESANPSVAPKMSHTHKPNELERNVLVWTGKYKSKDEIPAYISPEVMDRARNRFRIRLANVMMVLTGIGCILMVMSGKEAAERGESVAQMNLDWHAEYNEKARKEAEAAQKK